MEIYELTVNETLDKIKAGEITRKDVVESYIKRMNEKENDIQAFVTSTAGRALEEAEKIDQKALSGENVSLNAGIPIGIKDNICTEGIKTTCASKMLPLYLRRSSF